MQVCEGGDSVRMTEGSVGTGRGEATEVINIDPHPDAFLFVRAAIYVITSSYTALSSSKASPHYPFYSTSLTCRLLFHA